jgi:hypothetical protein
LDEIAKKGSFNRKTKKLYTDKKEKKIFLIYKEIQSGAVARAS